MNTQVPFINRINELAQIGKMVDEWGICRIAYLRAEGGTGKTRLLQEVRSRYSRWENSLFLERTGREHIRIVVVNEFTNSEWAARFIAGADQIANELEITVEQFDANYDFGAMAKKMLTLCEETPYPDAVIIRLGTDEILRPAVQALIQHGIPVLTIDNYLQSLDNVISITTDEQQGAYLASQQIGREIGASGKVIALQVRGVAMQEKRQDMLQAMLAQYTNSLELQTEWVEINPDMRQVAYEHTQKLLQQEPKMRAIWVTWDEFGRGVTKALMEAGRTDIGVYSFDLLSEADLDLMTHPDSPWKATITIDPGIVGRVAVHLAVSAAYKKPLDTHYSMPMQYITQQSLRERRQNWWSIWERLDLELMPRLLLPEIIDFDDYSFRDEQGFALKIVDLLGAQHFNSFFSELHFLNELKTESKKGDFNQDLIARHQIKVESEFISCLEKITDKQRLILLIDTVEKAGEILHFIVKILSSVHNIVILMAGRPEKSIENMLSNLGSYAKIIDLPRLEMKASELYLKEKQRLLNIDLDSSLTKKILYWTAGKPILIDLAVDWRARKDPLDWLVTTDLNDLKKISPTERDDLEKDFERQLVRHIINTRTKFDLLTLILAQVYPLDARFIHKLLNIPESEAVSLMDQVRDSAYIKVLPKGQITLHDEMRRLVNTYAWPSVDPDDEWRQDIHMAAVQYITEQIEDRQRQIDEQENIRAEILKKDPGQTGLSEWRDLQMLQEEVWMLKENLLQHLLITDRMQGFNLFIDLFDKSTAAYRYTPRLNWLEMVEAYRFDFTPQTAYEVSIRKAKALLDNGNYETARQVLDTLKPIKPEQKTDRDIQLANIFIRSGDLNSGIEHFANAVKIIKSAIATEQKRLRSNSKGEITRLNELKRWQVKAENGLGWAYRLIADLDAALIHYESALDLALDLKLQHEQVLLYNNMGFLYAYKKDSPRHYETALRYCTESYRLAQEIGEKRGIGRACSALGCIHFMAGNLQTSLQYFQDALEIFEPTHDEEWLSVIYTWRGAAYISSNPYDLTFAEHDLLRAREINIPKEQPMTLSRLGLLYLLKNDLEKAEAALLECKKLAHALPDLWYQWIVIRDLARLARYQKKYSQIEALEAEMQAYLSQNPKPDERAHGMLLMELGSLALGLGQFERGTQYYFAGVKILVSIGNYGGDTPIIYLERLQQEVFEENLHLLPNQIQQIGVRLLEKWKAEKLSIHYPEIRSIFSKWSTWELPNQ